MTLNVTTGIAEVEKVRSRKILRGMNLLHLNMGGKVWTYMADFYALALLLLGITGLFVLRGKKGITGRGALLAGIGIAIPIVMMILYAS